MSAPGGASRCAQCGTPLEPDGIACSNCGNVGASTALQPPPKAAVIGGLVAGTLFGFGCGLLIGYFQFEQAYPRHTPIAPVVVLNALQNLVVVAAFVIGIVRMRAGRRKAAFFLLAFGAAATLPTAACDVIYATS